MNRTRLAIACLGLLAGTSASRAGVILEYRPTNLVAWQTVSSNLTVVLNRVYNVDLNRPANGYWRIRLADPTVESLGLVRVLNGAGCDITLLIGGTSDSDVNGAARFAGAGANDWVNGLDPGLATVRLQARVNRDIGPRATIRANQIVRVDAVRNINQSAFYHTSDSLTLSAITAGGKIDDDLNDPASPAIIRSEGGPIAMVWAAGDVRTPIFVVPQPATTDAPLRGVLGRVESQLGNVGGARPSNAPPDNYTATRIAARVIDRVLAQEVRADIVATEGVRRIESISGALRGSVATQTILPIDLSTPGYIKAAQVNAMNITLNQGLPSTAKILSGSFFGYLDTVTQDKQPKITLAGQGLVGQILVNQANQAPMTWSGAPVPEGIMGQIVANSHMIDTDRYAMPSTMVGGGSVGVARYQLYAMDCSPQPDRIGRLDGVVESAFDSVIAMPIVIRHYGPIKLKAGTTDVNKAVRIERQSATDPCSWTDVSTLFSASMYPEPGTLASRRSLALSRGSAAPTPGVYRVVPLALVCEGVTGEPNVLWPTSCAGTSQAAQAYVFSIAPDCDRDGVNDNAQLDQIYAPANPPTSSPITTRTSATSTSTTVDPIDTDPLPPRIEPPNPGEPPVPIDPPPPPPVDPPPPPPPPPIDPPPPVDPPPPPPPPIDPPPPVDPPPPPPPPPIDPPPPVDPPPIDPPPPVDPPPPPPPPPVDPPPKDPPPPVDPPPPPPPPPPIPPRGPLTCVTVCLLDVNKDRSISIDDVFTLLSMWFAGDIRGDWNRNTVLDLDDIFIYLNDWFQASRTDCTSP